jgi:hypothetical protein
MPAVSPLLLAATVNHRYGADCAVVGSVWVAQEVPGQRPWIGRVWVVELLGHPSASHCFARGLPIEGRRGFECVTVLAQGPVCSPADAVCLQMKTRGDATA